MGHVLMACRCGEVVVPADEIEVRHFLQRWWLAWSCECGADWISRCCERLATEILWWQAAGKDAACAAFADALEACDDVVGAIMGGGR